MQNTRICDTPKTISNDLCPACCRLSPGDHGCQQCPSQPSPLGGEPNSYDEEWAQELPWPPRSIWPLAAGEHLLPPLMSFLFLKTVEGSWLYSQGDINWSLNRPPEAEQVCLLISHFIHPIAGVVQGEPDWSLLLGGGVEGNRGRHGRYVQGNPP